MYQTALQKQSYRQAFSLLLSSVLLILSACASTPQPTPDDNMYALSAMEAMEMLRDIKDRRTHPNHSSLTCSLSTTNNIEIYISNGFVIEEYWLQRKHNRLYLGVQHEYGRKLFEFANNRLYTMVEPTYFTHSIDVDTWALFWLGQISIHEVGENKITRKVAYDGGDELMEKIGTTRIQIFLEPVYSFLNTYYGADDDLALQPAAQTVNEDTNCDNLSLKSKIVGK